LKNNTAAKKKPKKKTVVVKRTKKLPIHKESDNIDPHLVKRVFSATKGKVLPKKKPAKKQKTITQRDRIFVFEYLVDMKPKRAALASGYSKTVAETKAYLWVSDSKVKPLVYKEIQQQLKKRAGKLEITADRVLQELAKMGFSNMEDYMTMTEDGEAFVDLSKLTRDQAAAIQEITVDSYFDTSLGDGEEEKGKTVKKIKIKLCDKKGNLELLGKNLKLWTDKVDLGGQEDNPVKEVIDVKGMDPKKLMEIIRGKTGV